MKGMKVKWEKIIRVKGQENADIEIKMDIKVKRNR